MSNSQVPGIETRAARRIPVIVRVILDESPPRHPLPTFDRCLTRSRASLDTRFATDICSKGAGGGQMLWESSGTEQRWALLSDESIAR